MTFIITNLSMGRQLTEDEKSSMTEQINAAVVAGKTSGTRATDDIPDMTDQIIVWTTTDAANAYAEFLNTFVPAPESVTVQTV